MHPVVGVSLIWQVRHVVGAAFGGSPWDRCIYKQ